MYYDVMMTSSAMGNNNEPLLNAMNKEKTKYYKREQHS